MIDSGSLKGARAYHRKRLAIQSAVRPYIQAQCELLGTAIPTMIIHADGHFERRYSPEVEKELEKLREMCAQAAEMASRQADGDFSALLKPPANLPESTPS